MDILRTYTPPHVLSFGTSFIRLLACHTAQQRPRDKRSKDLRERPVDRKNRKKILMRPGQEFQEDRRVHRKVTTNTDGPECSERAYSSEIGAACCNHAKYGSNTNGKIEGPSSAKYVTAKSPEDGPEEETDILGQ